MKILQTKIPFSLRIGIGLFLLGFSILGAVFYTLESRMITKEYKESQSVAESLLTKVNEANASTSAPTNVSSSPQPASPAEQPKRKIKLSSATQSELETLPGIGPVKARAIIDYRNAKGFKSINDLTKVKGIGQKTLDKLKPLVDL